MWVKQWFVGDFEPFFPTICLLLTSHDHDFPTEALRRALQQVGLRWNWGHLSHVSRILILLGYKFLLIFSLRHSAVVSEHALGERKQEKTRLNMLIDEHHSQFSTAQRFGVSNSHRRWRKQAWWRLPWVLTAKRAWRKLGGKSQAFEREITVYIQGDKIWG